MASQATAAAPPARAGGDEIVVYSPLARKTSTALAPPKAPTQNQTEVLQLQQTVQNLLRQNAVLRGHIRVSEQALRAEVQALRFQIAQAQQYGQMLHKQLLLTQHQLAGAQTRNHGRELHLAGIIKSVRLQLPCEEGPWSETQQLCSLDTEVEALRKFVEYQYQHERLWGSDEIHSPRFWYEQGGFRGYRTGPDGDKGIWRREVKNESKMVMKTMTRAVGVDTEAEEGGVEVKNVKFW